MTHISHQQAHRLLQQENRTEVEEQTLRAHLSTCRDCQAYARVHRQLQHALSLTVQVPDLDQEKVKQVTGVMNRRARRKRQMNGIALTLRPIAVGGALVAVLVLAIAFLGAPASAPEPSAGMVAADATATLEPAPTPEPTADPRGTLIEVALPGTEPQYHPQIGQRYSLTLEEAQQQAPFPLKMLTLLPQGFVFAGADFSNSTASQVFVLAGQQPSPILSLEQRQGALSNPGRDDQPQTADGTGVQLLPEGYALGDDTVYYIDKTRGVTVLGWTVEKVAYELTVMGDIWPLERLDALARSLAPLPETPAP